MGFIQSSEGSVRLVTDGWRFESEGSDSKALSKRMNKALLGHERVYSIGRLDKLMRIVEVDVTSADIRNR
jgi:hypothetical protein